MSHFKAILTSLFALCIALIGASSASAVDCTVSTYNSVEFKKPQIQFSPYEKIFVKILCTGLEAGEYSMHANWIHKKRGMIRSDKRTFRMDISGERFVFFWFKLSQKGPLSSLLTNKDFNGENFGAWLVEIYLNNTLVGSSEFQILPEGQ